MFFNIPGINQTVNSQISFLANNLMVMHSTEHCKFLPQSIFLVTVHHYRTSKRREVHFGMDFVIAAVLPLNGSSCDNIKTVAFQFSWLSLVDLGICLVKTWMGRPLWYLGLISKDKKVASQALSRKWRWAYTCGFAASLHKQSVFKDRFCTLDRSRWRWSQTDEGAHHKHFPKDPGAGGKFHICGCYCSDGER